MQLFPGRSPRAVALRTPAGLACGIALALAACGESATVQPLDTLRLSTNRGLEPMTPATTGSMTRNLQDLVYVPLAACAGVEARRGAEVVLRVRPGCLPAAGIAAQLRAAELISARPEGDTVVATFSSEETARSVTIPGTEHLFLDVGPYEPESFQSRELVLRRRSGRGPARIVTRAVDNEEIEWRLLLAHEIDLVPRVSPAQQRFVADVPSVRLVPLTEPATIALCFRVAGRLGEARLRRAISLAIRRRPLAAVVASDEAAAVRMPEDLAEARRLVAEVASGPIALRLVVPASFADWARAAALLAEQLAPLDVRLTPVLVDDEGLGRAMGSGDWDVLLFTGGLTPRYFSLFVAGSPVDFTGYASAEFDAAYAAGDEARAAAVLARDLPMTPLYVDHEAVAVDRRWCGIRPRTSYDYSWLADAHPCAPGELE